MPLCGQTKAFQAWLRVCLILPVTGRAVGVAILLFLPVGFTWVPEDTAMPKNTSFALLAFLSMAWFQIFLVVESIRGITAGIPFGGVCRTSKIIQRLCQMVWTFCRRRSSGGSFQMMT